MRKRPFHQATQKHLRTQLPDRYSSTRTETGTRRVTSCADRNWVERCSAWQVADRRSSTKERSLRTSSLTWTSSVWKCCFAVQSLQVLDFVTGSIIRKEDLHNYTVRWQEPIISRLPQLDLDLVTLQAPSGGPVLQMIMQLIDST